MRKLYNCTYVIFQSYSYVNSYGDRAPKGITARILAVCWMMISVVFLALFTANATTILAISQAEEDHTVTLGKRVILTCSALRAMCHSL